MLVQWSKWPESLSTKMLVAKTRQLCLPKLTQWHTCNIFFSYNKLFQLGYLIKQQELGKPHWKRRRVYSGIAQTGGGSPPLPEWFGPLILRRIVHVQRGICLVWGVWTLARMVWGTYAVKIEVQMAFAQVGPEIKCPRVPVWVKGGGCNRYLGNARIDPASFSVGLP